MKKYIEISDLEKKLQTYSENYATFTLEIEKDTKEEFSVSINKLKYQNA